MLPTPRLHRGSASWTSTLICILLGMSAGLALSAVQAQVVPGCPRQNTVASAPIALSVGVDQFTLADLNNDGLLDIVGVVRGGTPALNGIEWRLSTGSGAYGPVAYRALVNFPLELVVGDYNADGNADLAYVSVNQIGIAQTLDILFGDGSGSFAPTLYSPLPGVTARSVTTGDINNDGVADLVVTETSNPNLWCILGNPSGVLSTVSSVAPFSSGVAVSLIDVNLDGNLDAAVSYSASSNSQLGVHLGNGTGSFAAAVTTLVVAAPWTMASGDWNQDGFSDLVLNWVGASPYLSRNEIYWGTGGAVFTPGPILSDVGGTSDVEAADMDGDGFLDVITANWSDDSFTVHRGDGSGGFANTSTWPSGGSPGSMVIRDMNADGLLDVVLACQWAPDQGINIELASPGARFGPSIIRAVGTRPVALGAADLDLDGNLDLVVSHRGSEGTRILLGSGTGFVDGPVSPSLQGGISIGDRPLVIEDLNSDGVLDLMLVEQDLFHAYAGTGAATFGPGIALATSQGPKRIVSGKFNGDSASDIAVLCDGVLSCSGSPGCSPPTTPAISLYFPSAGGGVSNSTVMLPGTVPWEITAADFDNDGDDDLAIIDFSPTVGSNVTLLICDGAGGFSPLTTIPIGTQGRAITSGDINSDGLLDLVCAGGTPDLLVWLLGDGLGGFSFGGSLPLISFPRGLGVLDHNLDGFDDILLLASGAGTGTATLLEGDGAGGFLPTQFVVGSNPAAVQIGDFNADGSLDFAVANNTSDTLTIRYNTCSALSATITQPDGAFGALFLDNFHLISGREYYNVLSLEPCATGPGTGPPSFLGLCPGSATNLQSIISQVSLPLGAAPFHYAATGPQTRFGPYSFPSLSGQTIELVSFAFQPSLGLSQVSAVDRLTIR